MRIRVGGCAQVWREKRTPVHDVLVTPAPLQASSSSRTLAFKSCVGLLGGCAQVTNPPFSGEHKVKCLQQCGQPRPQRPRLATQLHMFASRHARNEG